MRDHERVLNILQKIGFLIAILCLLLPLGMYAATGWSSRLMADDYCFSAKQQTEGFLGAQVDWYQTWTNRFTTTLLISVSETLGSINLQLWPTLIMVAISISTAWGLNQVFKPIFGKNHIWMAVLIAVLVVFVVFFTAQNRIQSLFWRSGSVTYAGSLVVPGLLTGIVLSHSRWSHRYHRLLIMLCFVIAFLGAGFSESFAAVQTAILGFSLVSVMVNSGFRKQTEIATRLIGGLAGSLTGMGVVIVSPGNQTRQAMMTPTRDMGIVIMKSMQHGLDMMNYTIHSQPVPLLFMAVFVFLMALLVKDVQLPLPRKIWIWIPLSILSGYLFLAALCAPSMYAQSSYPETRVLLLGKFILLMIILGVFIPAGMLVKDNLAGRAWLNQTIIAVALVTLLGLCAYPVRAAWQARDEQKKLSAYAALWDARDQQIRFQAVTSQDIVVSEIQSQADPDNWVNRCAAEYYRVKTIQAINPSP
jgi:hypothetical protein